MIFLITKTSSMATTEDLTICLQDQPLTTLSKSQAISKLTSIFPCTNSAQSAPRIEDMGVDACGHILSYQHSHLPPATPRKSST